MRVENAGAPPTRRIALVGTAAFAVLFLLVSFYMFGQLRHSQLGLIDDHEIVRFLGSDHVIRPTDFLGILFGQTEVGHWGDAPRLRPVYYSLRIVESAVWGTDAGLWYLARMVLVAMTSTLMSVIVLRAALRPALGSVRRALVLVVSLIAGGLVLTLPSWSDIATRLGPSEIYVAPAVMVFALGIVEIWVRPRARHGWILLTVGYVIALGSKEDCLVLLAPMLVVTLLQFGPAAMPRLISLLVVIAAAATIYQVAGIALGTAGQDMYGNGRSVSLFVTVLARNPFVGATVFLAVGGLLWDLSRYRYGDHPPFSGPSRLFRLRSFPFTLTGFVSVVVTAGEAYLYQNYIDDGIFAPARYGFITELSLVASFTSVLVIVTRLVHTNRGRAWASSAVALIGVIFIVLFTPLSAHVIEFLTARPLSIALAARSQAVYAAIQAGVQDIKSHPGSQAVVIATDPLDYERVFSLPEYLSYYGAVDGVFLDVRIPVDSSRAPLLSQLAAELQNMQSVGKQDAGWRVFRGVDRSAFADTVCFYFGEAPSTITMCDSSHRID